jgi:hypothetical protein
MPYLYREHVCLRPGDFEFPDSYTQWPAFGDVWNCAECAGCWRYEKNTVRAQLRGAPNAQWNKIQ